MIAALDKLIADVEPIAGGKAGGGSWKESLSGDCGFPDCARLAKPLLSGPVGSEIQRSSK